MFLLRLSSKLLVLFFWVSSSSAQFSFDPQRRPECPGHKRVLVVSGGGLNGSYQLGAIWYLINVLDCDFQHFIGTSTGAVSAAVLAQSRDKIELRSNIDLLIKEYKSLKTSSDIAESRTLGLPRLLLPKWLGGLDGVATLAPLEMRLRTYINKERVHQDNLTIVAVSLQAGAIDPQRHRVDDLFDLIVGSASIPIIVEPRRARVWTRVKPVRLKDNAVLVEYGSVPGLADPECRFRVTARVFRCKQAGSAVLPKTSAPAMWNGKIEGERGVVAYTQLELFDLTEEDRSLIGMSIALTPAMIEKLLAGRRSIDRPLVAPEFSSVHQLVDGGVTDNTPLTYALRMLDRDGFDTVLTILNPTPPLIQTVNAGAKTAFDISKIALNQLWNSHQQFSFLAHERDLMLRSKECEVQQLRRYSNVVRDKLKELVGNDHLRDFEKTAEIDTVDVRPRFSYGPEKSACSNAIAKSESLWVFELGASSMTGLLDVQPAKIEEAFEQGCRSAATYAYIRQIQDTYVSYLMPSFHRSAEYMDALDRYAKTSCAPLVARTANN